MLTIIQKDARKKGVPVVQIIRRGKKVELPNTTIDRFNYWDDARWAEVRRLRATSEPADQAKADELEKRIKKHWKVVT